MTDKEMLKIVIKYHNCEITDEMVKELLKDENDLKLFIRVNNDYLSNASGFYIPQ